MDQELKDDKELSQELETLLREQQNAIKYRLATVIEAWQSKDMCSH